MKGVSEHDVRTIIELYIKGKISLVPNSILVVQNKLVFLFHVFFQCLRTAHRALLLSFGADLECDPFSQSCSLCLLSLCQSGHTFWNTCLFDSVLSKKCVSCPVPFSSSEHRGLALSSSGLGLDDHAFCGSVSKVYVSVNIV